MSSMIASLHKNFRSDNRNLCLTINSRSFSYSEMTRYISAIQNVLMENKAFGLVGIVVENSVETYASILAAWFSGIGFVPIHPEYPVDRNQNIIEQAKLFHILGSNSEYNKCLPESNISIINTLNCNLSPNEIKTTTIAHDKILCIMFSSGTTGVPKGIPLSLGNIECTLGSFFLQNYKMDAGDKFLQMFELTFDMSMISYLPAFVLGASVFTVGPDKIRYLAALKIMKEQNITIATMVPSTLALLRPYFSKISLPSLKYSIIGGEPFPSELAEAWSGCIPNSTIINISGPTEITMVCMSYNLNKNFPFNKSFKGVLAFGYPWANTIAIAVNDELELIADGVVGELCFAGQHVMTGYLNQEELNRKVFFEKEIEGEKLRFYRTGDLVFTENGFFYTCGRKDLQVKIQGHKIELEEIEFVARKILSTHDVYALTTNTNKGLVQINLVIKNCSLSEKAVMEKLREQLPPYMVPSEIIITDEFPYNKSGKIDRTALKELFR